MQTAAFNNPLDEEVADDEDGSLDRDVENAFEKEPAK